MHKELVNIAEPLSLSSLADAFSTRFSANPRIFRAPGRVNLIGEHTDYNDGFVLPVAIDLATWVAISKREDKKLVVHSENFGQSHEIDLTAKNPVAHDEWFDYAHGVAVILGKLGISVSGANLLIYSNVPLGSGLSSSAALEVSVASALLAISDKTLPLQDVALLSQRAENEFVGARCGIMDQFASCFGSVGRAILLDCRSLEYQLLPLPAGITLVISNTMVKHEHSGGEYNERRAQCEEGMRQLKKFFPAIKALRDVTLEQLESHRADLSDLIYRRCHHVVSENARVLCTVDALKKNDRDCIRRCMADSHRSLKTDYEVSCAELDTLVDIAAKHPATIGTRMTGGGFGGCTISLVESSAVADFEQFIRREYKKATNIDAEIYVTSAGAGVTEVTPNA